MHSTLHHFIDGKWVPPTRGETLQNLSPATGQVLGEVAAGTTEDVDAAVTAARRALGGPWGQTTVAERADFCDAVADAIETRLEELAHLESEDTGKPIHLARTVDIPRAVANFRFFAGQVRNRAEAFHPMPGAINYTLRQPLGVVGLITPWNLPLYLLSWKAAPALAMGNTVVAKPSELTPRTASALAEIVHEAGLPVGAFNLVHGHGAEAGRALVEHPDVSAISFTGGTETGRQVASSAAADFKKLSLELGGKNPTIVFADCEFDATVEGAVRAGFLNQGQVCLCGSRLFVERSLADRFVEAFVSKVESLQVGDPSDAATELGALVSSQHRDKVESYLTLAKEEGGAVVTGGDRPSLGGDLDTGYFLRPAVITGLPSSCRTATEEIFGPVVTVHPFDDVEQVIQEANAVRYGLSASIWTKDLDRAHAVSARLQSGMVWVNTWLLRDLRVPFGGMKDSGVGREGGAYSLEFFSEARNICVKLD